MDKINRHMKIEEIKKVLSDHNINLPLYWELSLWLLFNTYNADEAEITGFGTQAEINFITKE